MLYYSLGADFFISIVSRNSTRLLSTAITLVCLGCSKSDHGFSLAGLMVLKSPPATRSDALGHGYALLV